MPAAVASVLLQLCESNGPSHHTAWCEQATASHSQVRYVLVIARAAVARAQVRERPYSDSLARQAAPVLIVLNLRASGVSMVSDHVLRLARVRAGKSVRERNKFEARAPLPSDYAQALVWYPSYAHDSLRFGGL